MSSEEQKRKQLKLFGCDIDQYVKSVKESITFKIAGGLDMVIASELSDCQEMLLRGELELSRQLLNRVKYLLTLRMKNEI